MWFKTLTGFAEESPEQVRANLVLEGGELISKVNGNRLTYGELQVPSLAELRERVRHAAHSPGPTTLREVVADVQHLHTDKQNTGAMFQVASQFNLLEMISPNFTPERGVGIYERDPTQGPACAIAAGAGTIFRNYYAQVNGHVGQSESNQIDCLADLGSAWDNNRNRLWEMTNGYALATNSGLVEISERLKNCTDAERDRFRGLLRIGVQWETQVTLIEPGHTVSQTYCSALPVGYSHHSSSLWAEFAKLVLEASYEATICAAILNAATTGNNTLFLTLLGGGAFGNETDWIIQAIRRSLHLYSDSGLDVAIVSYGSPQECVQELLT